MPRCEVRWKRNPHIERALLQFSTDIPKSRHLDTPRSISRDRQGLWKPRIRVARLLFPAAVAFSTCTRNLSPSSPSLSFARPHSPLSPLSFKRYPFKLPSPLSSPLPFPRRWNTELGDLGFLGPVFLLREIVVPPRRNKIARAAANITRRNPRSFVLALFISFDRALQNLTSIGRLPMRDFGWYPLWFDWYSSWTRTSLRQ